MKRNRIGKDIFDNFYADLIKWFWKFRLLKNITEINLKVLYTVDGPSPVDRGQLIMKQIPNIFTLLNLVFGCCAIVFTLQNGIVLRDTPDGGQFIMLSEKLWLASLFIGLAAVTDFLDGFVARLFNATSEIGKQLDSLSDVVSFGVAPSMIIYQFLRMSLASEEKGLDSLFISLLPAFLIAAAAAYRLARFNLDNSQQEGFKGVPVPAAGLLIAGIPLIYMDNYDFAAPILLDKWFLYGLIIVISTLMVSKLPLMALKFTDYSVKNNLPKYILMVFSILAAVFLQWSATPVIFIAYIILSLAFKNKRHDLHRTDKNNAVERPAGPAG